ncbi:MAG: GGDEF domain-containing protein [Alphaproteobacteria bacterium]
MADRIWEFLSSEGFQPHGYCLLWRADLFWLHVVSDVLIVLAYFSIPAWLIYLASRRGDLIYAWVYYLFSAFIVGCGITHLFGIWTMWVPDYAAQGIAKALTAVISTVTAIVLWPLLPRLLAMPSRAGLERVNRELVREVRERREAQEALRQANDELRRALHDDLTGVAGRSMLQDTWNKAIARALRESRAVGLLMIDLDGFKAINDRLGHGVGDDVLRETAARLIGCVRASDTVARVGGDEFVVLLEMLREPDDTLQSVEKIRKALSRPFEFADGHVSVGASIGVALSTVGQANDLWQVLAQADADMYTKKQPDRAPRYRGHGGQGMPQLVTSKSDS